jgi:hypothetical protein
VKAFEKWWSEVLSEEELVKIRSNISLSTKEKVDRLAKQGWKAALEWVLENFGSGFQPHHENYWIYEGIYKELEEE